MAFAYAVFAQFLSLEVAALLEKKVRIAVFAGIIGGYSTFQTPSIWYNQPISAARRFGPASWLPARCTSFGPGTKIKQSRVLLFFRLNRQVLS